MGGISSDAALCGFGISLAGFVSCRTPEFQDVRLLYLIFSTECWSLAAVWLPGGKYTD